MPSDASLWLEQCAFDVALLAAGRPVHASPSFCASLGYVPDELARLSWEQVMDGPSLARVRAAMRAIAASECARADLDVQWLRRDAGPIACGVELRGIGPADEGRVLALSQRQRSPGEHEPTQQTLRDAFHSVNEPIAIFDKDGNVVDFNEAMATFNRFPDREAMRAVLPVLSDFMEIQSLDGQVLTHADWPSTRALRGETGRNVEFRLRRKDSGDSWLCAFNFTPMRDAAGAVSGAAVLGRDITEVALAVDALRRSHGTLETVVEERTRALVEAKAEADRANAGKTRFLAAASHDLRQPLQSASAYLGSLDTLIEDPAAKEMAEGLRNSIEVMAELLDSLLDISRLQSGAIQPNIETFPIADLLRRAMLDHAPAAEAKRLALRMHLEPCTIRTDHALLMRIVENLLSNAIRYTENGHITISNRLNGDEVTLEVSDSGIGIPAESLELIFEEYYQIENKSRDRTSGLGLGLSIVRYLTRLLGHQLRVSSAVGVGTTFTLTLPRGPEARAQRRSATRAQADEARAPIVLIVDDEPSIRHSLAMLLTAHGMIAHTADDAADVWWMLDQGLAPDLLLTDYRLPGTTGNELVEQLRQRGHAAIACVIMTGDTISSETLQKEMQDCLVMRKPIDCLRLPGLIREAIAARTLRPPDAEPDIRPES